MRGEKQMNRKEKKAVGLLKALNNLEKKCKIEKVPYKSEIKKIMISLLPEDYGIFEILLNLIEKLQKENEELKLYNNSITSQLEQMTTEKFKEGWIHQSEFKDFIPVQKVKDKIEEYKNMFLTCNKAKDIDRIKAINERILELQELLEGRK